MSAAAIWAYVSAGDKLVECRQDADELHRINGLQLGSPLIITGASRSAGGINQPVSEAGPDTTLSRDA